MGASWVDLDDRSDAQHWCYLVAAESCFEEDLLPLLLISLDAVGEHHKQIKDDMHLLVLHI